MDDVWDAKYSYADPTDSAQTKKFEAWVNGYYDYFYNGGKEAYKKAMSKQESVTYSQKAIEEFTERFNNYVEKAKEKHPEQLYLPAVDPELQSIIKAKDYKALAQHLKAGISNYLNGDIFKNYLRFVSQFHRYSSRNVDLILSQNPNATYVASFNKWKKLDNPVKKGGKATYIYAPNPVIKKDEKGNKIKDEKGNYVTELFFKLIPVFDASQTEHPDQLPRPIYNLPDNLEDPQRFAKLYQGLCEQVAVPVTLENIEGSARGYYLPSDGSIHIQQGMGEEMTLKTLVHEMTHALLHANSEASFGDSTYQRQEFEAESVAYIVCSHLGIDTSDYSFGYLSSWTAQGNAIESLEDSLQVITQQANRLLEQLDTTLSKVYELSAPQNKFEERLKIAKEQGEVTEKDKTEKGYYLNVDFGVEQRGQIFIGVYQVDPLENGNFALYTKRKQWFKFLDNQDASRNRGMRGDVLVKQLGLYNGRVPLRKEPVVETITEIVSALNFLAENDVTYSYQFQNLQGKLETALNEAREKLGEVDEKILELSEVERHLLVANSNDYEMAEKALHDLQTLDVSPKVTYQEIHQELMSDKQSRQILKMQFEQSVKILNRYNEIRADKLSFPVRKYKNRK